MTYAQRWSAVLLFVVTAFLVLSLPPYLTVDPARSRVPSTFGLHYPLLIAHIALATVAIVTALVQSSPGVRARWPRVHRRAGRVYVLAALLAAAFGMVIGAATPFGSILAVSNVVLAALWLWFTVNGYVAARRRRFAAHRRHMLRSVTLAFSIITNRIWSPILYLALQSLRDTVFGGDEQRFIWLVAGLSGWLGWTVPLVAVSWWLTRRPHVSPSSIPQSPDTLRV
ncbi:MULTISPECIES: DUF2306 domain-containing protein [unclassified Mycobacterium]|uniref:DUF2306 domain-containing protein n=1 Tax=unclassified Mycobacterium TaxID=2642494 RepID=UPI0029C7D3D4|nr:MULTISPECIES: DUF2306 domain-containing protein [unclassified Mycobacterium]